MKTAKPLAGRDKLKNFFSKIPGFFHFLFCLYIIMTFFLMITIDKRINIYYSPNILGIPNLILIIPSVLLFLLFAFVITKYTTYQEQKTWKTLSDKQFYLLICLVFAGVFFVQAFITKHINFRSGWDVGILINAAERLVSDPSDKLIEHLDYLSTNPNNLTMVYTLVIFFKLGSIIFPSNPYVIVILLANFSVCLSVCLTVLCIYKMTQNRCIAIIGMAVGICLTALSPWIQVPYTDVFGMPFPIAALFCFLFLKNQLLRYSLTTFFCTMGYLYKPTILILLIALIILGISSELFHLSDRNTPIQFKRLLCFLLALLLGTGCSLGVNKIILSRNHLELDANREKTWAHYLMMGLNTETEGVFSGSDGIFSDSYPDVESRNKANIHEAADRLKKMGGSGYVKHLIKKNLCNYNDGTFSFGREGNFYIFIPEERNRLDHILRQIFYVDGKYYRVLATAEHIIWLTVLLSICLCIVPCRKNRPGEVLIALTLLGVSIFLLLFECRSRYLYLFTPLYIVLASCGLQNASWLLNKFMAKKKQKEQLQNLNL